jgi:hypothetical protein
MQVPILQQGFPAAAVALATPFVAVKTATGVVVSSVAGEQCLGILQNKVPASGTASVMIIGRTNAIAGAAIAAEVRVASAGNGKMRTAQSGDSVMGRSRTLAAADGDIFEMFVDCATGAVIA